MKKLILAAAAASAVLCMNAESTDLNHGWRWTRGTELRTMNDGEAVDLPHTWNAADAMFGNRDYYRGMATYSRMLTVPDGHARYYLKVNAAQSVADVFVDNSWVGQHRGGYTAFVVDITPYVTPGKAHKLDIRVNNSATTDVAPLSGDFNIFGGLPRGVELIMKPEVCIAADFYASPGVFIRQSEVSDKSATLGITAIVRGAGAGIAADYTLCDASGRNVLAGELSPDGGDRYAARAILRSPRLWNGVDDPYLYTATVRVLRDGQAIDSVVQRIGLRHFEVSADGGAVLNGRPHRLNGVNLHEDRAEHASAYQAADFVEDVSLALEMGCNAIRLAHYPHSARIYDIMDEKGLVAWTEIPFVNIYISNPAYAENLRQQLCEMIYQNYNHACVPAWGLFNEVNSGWMEPVGDMVAELNALAHKLDPSRPTMGASNQDEAFNDTPDWLAFNKYFGWYGDDPADMATWLDAERAAHSGRTFGISEYGAGGNVAQQQDSLAHPAPWGQWHPENWQTHYHIENWRILRERPWLWCNFIWCLTDFCAAGRREGPVAGRNDKGLVSYDRSTRKDAFYFYKANWNKKEPMVYIAGKRCTDRTAPETEVMVFCNDGPVELIVNGRSYGKRTPDEVCVVRWSDVTLQPGENRIEARTGKRADACRWVLRR